MAKDFVTTVVRRLRRVRKPISEIADEAGVPASWLYMFRRGRIDNPGVRHFERVRAYLDRTTA